MRGVGTRGRHCVSRRVSCLDLALPTRSIGGDVTVGEVASAAGLMGLAAIVAADAADDFS